jgi:hypothetical protein
MSSGTRQREPTPAEWELARLRAQHAGLVARMESLSRDSWQSTRYVGSLGVIAGGLAVLAFRATEMLGWWALAIVAGFYLGQAMAWCKLQALFDAERDWLKAVGALVGLVEGRPNDDPS